MASAKPQTIASELLDTIEHLLLSDETPSEFELAKIKRSAKKLMQVDAAHGHLSMSGVAALEWDIPTVQYHVKIAAQLDSSPQMLANISLSLSSVNQHNEASKMMELALSKAKNDATIVENAIDYLGTIGHFEEAAMLQQAASSIHLQLKKKLPDFAALHLQLQEIGSTAERLQYELACAHTVLTKHKHRYRGVTISTDKDPESQQQTLVLQVIFIGTTDEEIALDSELAVRLCEQSGWNPGALAVEFSCITEDAYIAS